MIGHLYEQLFAPLLRRIGTAVAAYLVATGNVDENTAAQLAEGVTALLLVAVDLANSYRERKRRAE